ncbi:hypothetical protein [Tamlana crocina]|uniref:Uncharacterized protein n=1 Tax=Tamlana crocina TaxID=393006 RepID=A0ABX1DCQ0_9FLAO|nr:hypothetical protein [Tamlana crocina]NJX16135.1 hypothetical protein [Tamlana crocina]
MVDGIENVIASLHAKGKTECDVEEQICGVCGFDVFISKISCVTEKGDQRYCTLRFGRTVSSVTLFLFIFLIKSH